jgi:hypothetical protein
MKESLAPTAIIETEGKKSGKARSRIWAFYFKVKGMKTLARRGIDGKYFRAV